MSAQAATKREHHLLEASCQQTTSHLTFGLNKILRTECLQELLLVKVFNDSLQTQGQVSINMELPRLQ